MLRTQQLEYTYSGNKTIRFPDIHCEKGSQWLLLGQSGTGKTTLLHLIGGIRKPQKGKVFVADQALNNLSSTALDQFRGKNIGIVFQQSHFVQSLTVGENLQLAQTLAGHSADLDRIKDLLNRLNIVDKINDRTNRLSQGEQQRVAIARALVNSPGLILADEPTSALDDENCREVIALLETQAKEEGATLVIVTHDSRLKEFFDHKIILE